MEGGGRQQGGPEEGQEVERGGRVKGGKIFETHTHTYIHTHAFIYIHQKLG